MDPPASPLDDSAIRRAYLEAVVYAHRLFGWRETVTLAVIPKKEGLGRALEMGGLEHPRPTGALRTGVASVLSLKD